MSLRTPVPVIVCLLALMGLCAVSRADQSADITRGITDLGDTSFKVREDAMQRLWFIGNAAMPALRKAAATDDPEIKLRAAELLEKIESGVLPNMPPEIEKKLREFYGTYPSRKNQLFGELLEYEPDGHRITAALIDREQVAAVRQKLIVQNWPVVLAQSQKWIVEGDFGKAQDYIGTCADNGPLFFAQSFSAMAVLRGTLDVEIGRRKDRAKTDPGVARTLSWLYKADGRLEEAVAAAKLTDDEQLIHGMLREKGDWKELAELSSKPGGFTMVHPVERLGLAAAYHRLLGKEELAARFIKEAAEVGSGSPWGVLTCEVYLINDQVDGAEKCLLARENDYLLGLLYLSQGRMADAQEVFKRAEEQADDEGVRRKLKDLKDALPETDPPLENLDAEEHAPLLPPSASGLAEWEKLARQYDAQWQTNRASARLLYLRGWALTNAGRKEEGEASIEKAMLLPVGDPAGRRELIDELKLLGLKEQVAAQERLLIRTSDWASAGRRDAICDQMILPALDRENYVEAAERYELLRLNHFSHLRWPRRDGEVASLFWHLYYSQRRLLALAHDAIAGGRTERAIEYIKKATSYLPGDIDVPITFCNKLDRLGRRDDADALFGKAMKFAKRECEAFPKRASFHNQLAWLSARCRRDLGQGLEHAKKAVSLAPTNHAYIDTLAEVHFQMGNSKKAIEHMGKCLDLEPSNKYYESQMERFKKGDPETDPRDELVGDGSRR